MAFEVTVTVSHENMEVDNVPKGETSKVGMDETLPRARNVESRFEALVGTRTVFQMQREAPGECWPPQGSGSNLTR